MPENYMQHPITS